MPQDLRRSTSTASESSTTTAREGTRQKWKSLGLSDSDGSDDDERLRESGKKPDKSESVGGGLNFYCDMISPSPSSSSPELSDSAAEDQVETAPCVVRSVREVLFILLEVPLVIFFLV